MTFMHLKKIVLTSKNHFERALAATSKVASLGGLFLLFVYYLFICSFALQCWGKNAGPSTWQASALPPESCLQPFCLYFVIEIGSQ
jgi:hypothetical protein